MKRAELHQRFDDAINRAFDSVAHNYTGRTAWGIAALAIAVRGLWSDAEPTLSTKPVDERDFLPPINQGGG